jgi:hypothetical protein
MRVRTNHRLTWKEPPHEGQDAMGGIPSWDIPVWYQIGHSSPFTATAMLPGFGHLLAGLSPDKCA